MSKPERARRTRSFPSTMKAILWSFTGLRSKRDFDEDVEGGMNPVYVIIGGLLGTAAFIAILLSFASYAVA